MKIELIDLSIVRKAGNYCCFQNCIIKLSKKDMERLIPSLNKKNAFPKFFNCTFVTNKTLEVKNEKVSKRGN